MTHLINRKIACAALLISSTLYGADYYASPSGTATSNGNLATPWSITVALSGGFPSGQLKSGDTVWLRGGSYPGIFVSTVTGVTFRAYQAEQPTLDGYVHGTTTAAMTAAQTTIPVAQLNVPANTVLDIGAEAIRIHGYSTGLYVGVDRGWNGTIAATHALSSGVDTDTAHTLTIQGASTTFRDIEVTVSVSRWPSRRIPTPGSNPFGRPPSGIEVNGTGNRVINCYVHDTSDGISTSAGPAAGFELHGNLVLYTGWDAPDRAHGHSLYIHNDNPGTSQARLGGNIVLDSFDVNSQIYTGGATLGNVQIDGLVSAQAGAVSSYGANEELVFGFQSRIVNSSLTNSAIYAKGTNGFGVDWGYSGGTDFCTLSGNYIAGQNTALAFKSSTNFTGTGNTYVGPCSAPPASGTFLAWKPASGTTVIVSPNAYEPGRANVAVFNWGRTPSVSVDLTGILSVGDSYVVKTAWNALGSPVKAGVYPGGLVGLPAVGLAVQAPVGLTAPPETGPEFNVYIIVRKVSSPTPTPTPVPTATPTATPTPTPTATPTPTFTPTWTDYQRDQHIHALEGVVYTPTPTP